MPITLRIHRKESQTQTPACGQELDRPARLRYNDGTHVETAPRAVCSRADHYSGGSE